MGFIIGKNILERVIVVQEVIHQNRKSYNNPRYCKLGVLIKSLDA